MNKSSWRNAKYRIKISHTGRYAIMNSHANDRNNNKTHGKEREKEKRKLDHSRHFTIVFFLLPPSTPISPYPYYVPLQVRSFPPLLALFGASFFFSFPSLFPDVSSCGVGVAGPHPSQTAALMVPCSVQPRPLQFCHSEHWICGGWRRSPPSTLSGTSQMEQGEL